MTSFTIIGTGNMGTAIGGLLADGGNTVTHISHSDIGTKPLDGDVVVLAVPYPAIAAIISAYPGAFDGKTVVDITNPLNFETFDSLVVPVGSSAAAELAAALPGAKVLKAFNTNFAATLVGKSANGAKTTVLVAGDDAAAKKVLTDAVQAGGVEAIDAGSLARAHELEAIGFLQLTLAIGEKIGWTGGFTIA
ncbi:MAG: diguanylate cyclase [Actinobacteria bacterium HGW-Actinobacteria-2]|nr:MAG: diguanylate cyclase [Actinobacteria bacterium HGW-Actinobacteria-2]